MTASRRKRSGTWAECVCGWGGGGDERGGGGGGEGSGGERRGVGGERGGRASGHYGWGCGWSGVAGQGRAGAAVRGVCTSEPLQMVTEP